MLTLAESWTNGQRRYFGLSKDGKPLYASNGDLYTEMDTAKIYLFSAENNTWYEQPTEGGGGGSDPIVGEAIVGIAIVG